MLMRVKAVLAAATIAVSSFVGWNGAAAQSLVLHTSPFLLEPEKRIGFEGVIEDLSYEENGIRVSYVGDAVGIWTGSQAADGLRSWYPDGGGFGYTRIEFGRTFSTFQFAGGTGWFQPQDFGRGAQPALQFRLLQDGELLAQGLFRTAPFYSGFRTFGFSGLSFDEVHLQSQLGEVDFFEGGLDALAIDSLGVGGPVIPEPASWMMMIAGFGLVGGMVRRRGGARQRCCA